MKLLVVAGEVSGDHHAGALLAALARRVPDLSVFGVGGERCEAAGVRLVAHQRDLAVVGFVEAFSKVLSSRRLGYGLIDEARRERVDGAVLIDFPDFNLPLAKLLRKAGVPVVFYVSPQVWAWRSRRARKIADRGRAILVLFGFEKRWYDARGLGRGVTWVGHPLVDEVARELATPAAPPPDGRRRVVLMPGSREGEVRRILPVLRGAADLLEARFPGIEIVLVRAEPISEALVAQLAGPSLSRWTVVTGPHLALLAASDVLLVASGTATLEGLLSGVPMVVVYKLNRLSYLLGRLLVKVPHFAMANLVSDPGTGERAVPELLQGEANPARVAEEAARFLEEPGRADRTRALYARGRADLGPPGAGDRAAEALLAALGVAAVATAERAGSGEPVEPVTTVTTGTTGTTVECGSGAGEAP